MGGGSSRGTPLTVALHELLVTFTLEPPAVLTLEPPAVLTLVLPAVVTLVLPALLLAPPCGALLWPPTLDAVPPEDAEHPASRIAEIKGDKKR